QDDRARRSAWDERRDDRSRGPRERPTRLEGAGRRDDRDRVRPGGADETRGTQANPDELALPDDVAARDLDPQVRRELSSLARSVADLVARRLVASGRLLDADSEA